MLRQRCPRAVIAHFWHIPWPNPEVFRICPWKQDILRGMLGNDILGFHIRYHGDNFIATVDRELEARIDREQAAIIYRRHMTKIRAFPISIDFEAVARQASAGETDELIACLRKRYNLGENIILGVGADRIDYTKGLPERIEGVNRFLERYPEYRGRFVFFQAGVPSRTHVSEYRRLNEEVDDAVRRVNQKYGTADWCPVIFRREHLPLSELLAWYRMARFAIVSSLHDGMNLVAKEFVAARADHGGVLLLSRFTGVAREFRTDAVLINPYATDDLATAIQRAIVMDPDEVRRRMTRMREQVRENNVYKWAADIVRKLSKVV
jgi:trehalose 6-phosphate synthase